MAALIEVNGVSAGYRGNAVVRDISFSVNAGERVSIIGANGCGKTTLLKAICKLLPLMSGEVSILGRSISRLSRRELAESISMMAQISEQWFDFTVLDTVLMGRYSKRRGMMSSHSTEDRRIAEQCLETVGMLEMANDSITWLSGGQRQRVMLARAFAQEPQVIMLDEPTNHLDLKHQAELFDFLKTWVSQGERAVVQVMHDLNFARMYSSGILLMNAGELIASGTPDDIMGGEALDTAYSFNIRSFMKESYRQWRQ